MIYCIEGQDAAGKATQAAHLKRRLTENGISCESMSFPTYSTDIGQLVTSLLKSKTRIFVGDLEDARLLQCVQTTNRYEHYEYLASFAKRTDRVLVLDRYWLSGLAYGTADGLDPKWLLQIHEALPKADITFYLDVDVEESFRRRPARRDAYEASRERLTQARNAYLKACEDGFCRKIDGMRDQDVVAEEIWQHVKAYVDMRMSHV